MSANPFQQVERDVQATTARPLLCLTGIGKRFGALAALRDVDFDVLPGEVHGLLGQNGAGKTTLIKLVAGIETPSTGEMRLNGEPVRFRSAADSRRRGISVVHQSLSLVPTLTVADNMYLGVEARKVRVLLDRKTMNARAERLLRHYGIPLRPTQTVATLPFAYRQLLEIAKALAMRSQVLILDEPTSSLTKDEEQILFSAVRELTANGIGVMYVSHRLSEIIELTDRVTVLRDGAKVASFKTADTTIPELVEAIVGRSVDVLGESLNPPSVARREPVGATVLELQEVRSRAVNGANIVLRQGEVVGLVGTTGSGRTEILETIFGARAVTSGRILHHGRRINPKSPSDAIRRGIKLVPEDRHKWGLVLAHTIERNIAMSNLPAWTRGHLLFDEQQSRQRGNALCQHLKVKAPSIQTRADRLSGGNQQKVVIGKWLEGATDVLLLDEPTAGVDVGARGDIYRTILQIARDGAAVLVSSSDYAELMQICTAFVFVTNGETSEPVPRDEIQSEHQLHELLEGTRKAGTQ